MTKKVFICFFSLIFLYISFIIISYYVTKSTITYKNEKTPLKLSELISINENRINYQETCFFKNDFMGFNAIIDNEYYITVTNLGKSATEHQFNRIFSKPTVNKELNFFSTNDTLDLNFRLIDVTQYPYKIENINYYVGNYIIEIKQEKFFEIITVCTEKIENFESDVSVCGNIYFSFDSNLNSNFGILPFTIKNSYSFIKHKDDLYLITLFAFSEKNFKNLHELISLK